MACTAVMTRAPKTVAGLPFTEASEMDMAGGGRFGEAGKYVLKKLPEVTLAFWVMKVAATTLGETAGDLFSQTLKLGYFLTTVALFAIFVVTLVVQLRSKQYNPVFYWMVILSTSMAGTTISDFMNRDASFLKAGPLPSGSSPDSRSPSTRLTPSVARPSSGPPS